MGLELVADVLLTFDASTKMWMPSLVLLAPVSGCCIRLRLLRYGLSSINLSLSIIINFSFLAAATARALFFAAAWCLDFSSAGRLRTRIFSPCRIWLMIAFLSGV